jgi:hypothetical protein
MRVGIAIVLTLAAVPAHSGEQWFVGERGVLNLPLQACSSYQDWARFEVFRYREFDHDAAVKFLDQRCPTVITGKVVVEQVAQPPAGLGMSTLAVCLRPVGDPGQCHWLDSDWLKR